MTTDPERYPEQSYALAEGERIGLPAIAMMNVAYGGYHFCAEFPWLIEITVQVVETNDAGLPTSAEADALNSCEDELEKALSGVVKFHHIARQSWNRTRNLDYYVSDDKLARQTLEALQASGALGRSFTFNITRDKNWSTWMPTLERF